MEQNNILNLKRAIEGIQESINSHTLPLFYRSGIDQCKLLGTAVFIELSGNYILLTVGHVAIDNSDNDDTPRIYIPTTSGIIDSDGVCISINDDNDIGFIWLSDAIGDLLKYSVTPLREDQLQFEVFPDENIKYYVAGYPANLTQYYPKALQPTCVMLRTRPVDDKVLKYHKKNRVDHCVMQWDNLTDPDGKRIKRHRPEGMSGSGLWYVVAHKDFLGRYNITCHLGGIMHEYKMYKYPVLIGTPIRKVIDYIKPILESTNIIPKPNFTNKK